MFATEIAAHDRDHIWVRGLDLNDLIGNITFTEMVFLLIGGRLPDDDERHLLDAITVSLVEHGLTPSAAVARMTASVAPEALQGAVAAGLLGAGGRVLGSMEACGRILTQIGVDVESGCDRQEAARLAVRQLLDDDQHVPGVGHAIHTDGDPRAKRLFEVAEQCGRRGAHVAGMEAMAAAAEQAVGKRLPINATGAIAALLLELGIPWPVHRGFALISRTPGLIAHIAEEAVRPITPTLRRLLHEQR